VQAPFATRDIATNNKQIEIIQNTDTGITNPNSTPRNGIENTSPIEYGNTVGTAVSNYRNSQLVFPILYLHW
jgi:hypothetical protein